MRSSGVKAMPATLGIRSLREEYMKPMNKADIPGILAGIEECIDPDVKRVENIASEERHELKRFAHLFSRGELLPPAVFVAALSCGTSQTLNGRQLPYDADVLVFRDNLVATYKPLVAQLRRLRSREIEYLPPRLVQNFLRAWYSWETAWLRNCEVHAVEALQPLAKAILALEPLLLSVEKERLLPWPRVQHQKAVTLKCLEGFVDALAELAGCVLPSLQRELDHDPRLLLLMDHTLCLRGEGHKGGCLAGISATPDVAFPEIQARGSNRDPSHTKKDLHASASTGSLNKAGSGVFVDEYAFRLLGASVGDARASGKLPAPDGRLSPKPTLANLTTPQQLGGPAPSKESELSQKAGVHATELLSAFENVKDMLLSLKPALDHIDPALDQDEAFRQHLVRFERAFRRAKRLFLEPDNLA